MIWAPAKRGQPRGFGIPLVPTDAGADAAEPRVEAAESKIARREIKLFIVERIVGNVHLAIHARGAAVGVEDHRRVVIQAGGAALEQRADNHHAMLGRGPGQRGAGGAGNRFGLVKPAVVFGLARILAGE